MDLEPTTKDEAPAQWTSITGQPLKLDTAPSVLGTIRLPPLTLVQLIGW